MHQTLTTSLPVSWLASRLGADPVEIDRLRERGELFANRDENSCEWLYPVWQFGPGGSVPRGVRAAVSTARTGGLTQARLLAVLARRVGLMGGGRLGDLLFEGSPDSVIAAIRSAATDT